MENMTTIRLELGIAAQQVVSMIKINNQTIEAQIAKGIELAINDIAEGDSFVEAIRHNTKKELENIVNSTVMSWEVKDKITKMVALKIEKKIEEYGDSIAEQVTKHLK